MFLPSFTNSITQARKKEEAEKEREKRKESPHDYPRLFHLSSSRRTRESLVWLRSPAQDTKDQICHLLTIHGLECNPLGETGLGWTVWWAKKRAGIGNSSARWRGELDGGGGSSWAVSNGWRRIAARPSSFCPRVLPYLRSVLSASVKTRLCRVSLHPCSFTSLSVLINPFFPLLRRFPRASLALYRNSRESFPLTDRNKNATHRSASLQRPDLLLLSSFFSSLSSFFTGEGIGATRVQPATLFTPGMNLRRYGASWIRTYWLLYRGLRVLRLLSGNPSQMEPLELRYSATFRVLSSACGWKDTCSQTGARSNGDWADLNEEDIEKPLLDFFNVESFYLFFILNPLFTIHHEYYIRKKIIRVAMRSEARPAINKTLQFLSPSSMF